MRGNRAWAVSAAVVGAVIGLVAPAAAQQPEVEVAGRGTVGVVTAQIGGQSVGAGPLAPCDVTGPGSGSTRGTSINDVVSFGSGSSTCTVDANGFANVVAEGKRFRLDALTEYGGPTIKMSSFTVSCRTTVNGSTASISLSGLSGITVPSSIPSNYTVMIPGSTSSSPPIARVVVNEKIVPSPPDGSMTVNLMRVELFPEGGGQDEGEFVVGQVHCDPDNF